MDLRDIKYKTVDWILLAQGSGPRGSVRGGEFLTAVLRFWEYIR
jgi:hypothetical protein